MYYFMPVGVSVLAASWYVQFGYHRPQQDLQIRSAIALTDYQCPAVLNDL